MKIVVLYNAPSEEATVAEGDVLVQRDAVTSALGRLGHDVTALACTLDLAEIRRRLQPPPDVVFNLVESLGGTDRLMPAATLLLDALHVPYTGSPTGAILATLDKVSAKEALFRAGLPTAPWFTAEAGAWQGRRKHRDAPIRQVIVKAVWEHASFGMIDDAVVTLGECAGHVTSGNGRTQQGAYAPADAALLEIIRGRERSTGRPFFAEPFLDGREFNLTLLADETGPQALPPAEIDFSSFPADKPRIVGHDAKWNDRSFEYHHTPRRFDFPRSDRPLLVELQQLAIECWRLFGLRGYARVDFRVDRAGQPWILEANANPSLSPDAGFAAAIEQAGIVYDEALRRVVGDADLSVVRCQLQCRRSMFRPLTTDNGQRTTDF